MNMFEEAAALSGTIKMCSLSQTEMAKKLGVSQSYVANKLRLLSFDKRARERIIKAGLTERHARTLLRLVGRPELTAAIERIEKEKLNVERSEALVDFLLDGTADERIGGKTKLDSIEAFKDSVKRAVNNLVSLGVDAKRSVSYYGSRIYITVSIDETDI